MKPKYQLKQSVFIYENGFLVKATIGGINIRQNIDETYISYTLLRKRHGLKVEGHYEKDVFGSVDELVEKIKATPITDETFYHDRIPA